VFVRAVVFDLFNTLVLLNSDESTYTVCLRKLHDVLIQNQINIPFEEFLPIYVIERDTLLSEASTDLREPHFNTGVSRALTKLGYTLDDTDPIIVRATQAYAHAALHLVTLDHDAHPVLQQLFGQYKLGLISNLRLPALGKYIFTKYALTQYFDVMLISGEEGIRKPHPRIFEKALGALGVKASEAVFIGDMLDLDVQGPQRVGMKTIFIKRRLIDDLYVQPDYIISQLVDVLDIVAN
jgi:HAD superfamily hydrolase (TIGR01509 family)